MQEAHGRKILLARQGGAVYATDAHCFHMGGNLWEGDIEDIGGHACVVCPLHRYKVSTRPGCCGGAGRVAGCLPFGASPTGPIVGAGRVVACAHVRRTHVGIPVSSCGQHPRTSPASRTAPHAD